MINKDIMIRKITKAINVYPTEIDLKREIREDDGMGGYLVTGEKDVKIFRAFLDMSGSSLSVAFSDGGKVERITKITLLVPFSNEFEILKGDYFKLNNVTYRVKNPNLQFDICYLAELEEE